MIVSFSWRGGGREICLVKNKHCFYSLKLPILMHPFPFLLDNKLVESRHLMDVVDWMQLLFCSWVSTRPSQAVTREDSSLQLPRIINDFFECILKSYQNIMTCLFMFIHLTWCFLQSVQWSTVCRVFVHQLLNHKPQSSCIFSFLDTVLWHYHKK